MSKSVYSLILSDEVMSVIDRLADRSGTSRSNYVNQLLAQSITYETPEMRMKRIFASVENLLSEHESLRFFGQPAGSMLTVKSALAYKYKPTVKYSVEIYGFNENSPYLGEFKVSSRSGNEFFINAIEDFYRLWIVLEKKYVSPNIGCEIIDGRFRRVFFKPKGEYSADEIAKIITDYIDIFDTLINAYFSNLENLQFTIKKLEEGFKKSFNGKPLI